MDTVLYSQPQDTPLAPPEPKIFWNTRGRAVEIRDDSVVKALIQRGFVRADDDAKPGTYNPLFDRGLSFESRTFSATDNKMIGDVLVLIPV